MQNGFSLPQLILKPDVAKKKSDLWPSNMADQGVDLAYAAILCRLGTGAIAALGVSSGRADGLRFSGLK